MNGLERLATLRCISQKKGCNWIHKDLFRLLNKTDIWNKALSKVYSKKKDYISNAELLELTEKKLEGIKKEVLKEKYVPINKKYKTSQKTFKEPTADKVTHLCDEVVQKVIFLVLESIFEPISCETTFGIGNKKSPHSALKFIEKNFKKCDFIITGKMENLYNYIDHNLLCQLLNKHIRDNRFINLIRKFLNAGILANEETTILGRILFNIYLSLFDKSIQNENNIRNSEIPNRRIHYVRYLEDWVIGIEGNKKLGEIIKEKTLNFLTNELKLNISKMQTDLICLTSGKVSFLNYDIYSSRSHSAVKRCALEFEAPIYSILATLQLHGFIKRLNKGYRPIIKSKYTFLSDELILLYFNKKWSSIRNYYFGATNFTKLQYVYNLLKLSCSMTLAHKHNKTCNQIFKERGSNLATLANDKKTYVFFESRKRRHSIAKNWNLYSNITSPAKGL